MEQIVLSPIRALWQLTTWNIAFRSIVIAMLEQRKPVLTVARFETLITNVKIARWMSQYYNITTFAIKSWGEGSVKKSLGVCWSRDDSMGGKYIGRINWKDKRNGAIIVGKYARGMVRRCTLRGHRPNPMIYLSSIWSL